MAVFTPITFEDACAFCDDYAHIERVDNLTPIEAGTDNTNYILAADGKKYILTIFEDRIIKSDLAPTFELIDRINDTVIAAPRAYANTQNKIFGEIKGKPAALIEFIVGKSVLSPNQEHCRQMGSTLAKMHLATDKQGFNLPHNRLSYETWIDIYNSCKDKLPTKQAAFIHTIQNTYIENWPDKICGLPMGAIHADVFPDNVFFSGDTISGVIDFYFSCRDFYIYDLALTVNAWCFDEKGHVIEGCLTSFLEAYQDIRPLNTVEKKYLTQISIGAAFRIFVTRLRDIDKKQEDMVYTAKDPSPYLNIIKFYHENDIRNAL